MKYKGYLMNEFTAPRKSAPLPFIGQKRQFIRYLSPILKDNIPNDGEGWTIVDVFGGSGLLAHTAKCLLPRATVIYNDFDDYTTRLAHIADTNRLRRLIFDFFARLDLPKNAKLAPSAKADLLALIQNFDGFIDVQTIAAWILFGGNQVATLEALAKKDFYNRTKKSDCPPADDYLGGLIVTQNDYMTTLDNHKDTPKCLLLLDPPYILTNQNFYDKKNYFGMTSFLKLMDNIKPPYMLFGGSRSELLNYMHYLEQKDGEGWQRLGGFTLVQTKGCVNFNASYTDNMLVKF